MSLLIVGMDITIVNAALPSIRADLHASVSGLQWVIDAYTVVLASLLILSGSTADRLGRRRTFQVGLVLFTLGSLLCSIAPGLGWLVAFRMMQAVGGSMLNPVAMSIITNVFTDPRERARAIGVYGGVVGISLGVGPVVGGALIESIGWRSIFWINVPIGIAAFVLAAIFVPDSKAERARRMDPVGQILVIAVLLSLTYAIIEAPGAGDSPEIWALALLCLAALVALLRYESRRKDPLIELTFFRSIPFSGATATAVCALGAFSAFLFLNNPLPAGRSGSERAASRAVPAADGDGDRGVRTHLRTDRRQPRPANAAADCRGCDVHRCAAADQAHRQSRLWLAACLLPGVRARLRHGERSDHERCRFRDAPQSGRRGSRGRVHQPSDRRIARRCYRRWGGQQRCWRQHPDRVLAGEPPWLVDRGRVWCRSVLACTGHDGSMGRRLGQQGC